MGAGEDELFCYYNQSTTFVTSLLVISLHQQRFLATCSKERTFYLHWQSIFISCTTTCSHSFHKTSIGICATGKL